MADDVVYAISPGDVSVYVETSEPIHIIAAVTRLPIQNLPNKVDFGCFMPLPVTNTGFCLKFAIFQTAHFFLLLALQQTSKTVSFCSNFYSCYF